MIETVTINFKGLGIKAKVLKSDFNPAVHKLWTLKDEKKAKKLSHKGGEPF